MAHSGEIHTGNQGIAPAYDSQEVRMRRAARLHLHDIVRCQCRQLEAADTETDRVKMLPGFMSFRPSALRKLLKQIVQVFAIVRSDSAKQATVTDMLNTV